MKRWLFLVLMVSVFLFPLKGWGEDLIPARILKVIEADIVLLKMNNEQVEAKLIGVQVPNKPFPSGKPYADMARAFMKKSLSSLGWVLVEFDKVKKDRYGRYLVYLFAYGEEEPLNLLPIREGLAYARVTPPNTKYSVSLLKAQKEARIFERNIWSEKTSYQWDKDPKPAVNK